MILSYSKLDLHFAFNIVIPNNFNKNTAILQLLTQYFCRCGEIGRRAGLKIQW